MIYEICYYFLMFFIYSIIGYFVEVTCVSLTQKKLVLSRGYLIGPYLPIFGCGSIIITLFLHKYQNDPLALFVMATVYCCVLEYFTSLILEKIFKLRWWDYSDKKFNLNGRICLETGVLFGLGGVFIIELFNPLIMMFLNIFSYNMIIVLGFVLAIIMIADFVLSTYTIVKLKIDTKKYINQDATRIIKDEVKKSLRRYRYFHNRLLEAFPAISKYNSSISKIREIVDKRMENRNKKNEKGFTLVELLVTMSILGIITLMSFPIIRNISNNNERKKYTEYLEILEDGARLYVDNYEEDLFCYNKSGCAYVTYEEMEKRKLIKDIQVDGISCNTDNTFVKIEKKNGKYTYTAYMNCVNKDSHESVIILPDNPTPHVKDDTICYTTDCHH